MKISAKFLLICILVSGCTDRGPDFSELRNRMSKSEVLQKFGEPDKVQFLVKLDSGENMLVDVVPENLEAIREHWFYTGKRSTKISETRTIVQHGETTVVFGAYDDPNIVSGSWFRNPEFLAARARARADDT